MAFARVARCTSVLLTCHPATWSFRTTSASESLCVDLLCSRATSRAKLRSEWATVREVGGCCFAAGRATFHRLSRNMLAIASASASSCRRRAVSSEGLSTVDGIDPLARMIRTARTVPARWEVVFVACCRAGVRGKVVVAAVLGRPPQTVLVTRKARCRSTFVTRHPSARKRALHKRGCSRGVVSLSGVGGASVRG